MNHNRYDELLYLYIYGELGNKDITEFKEHLSSCAICQDAIHELQRLNKLLEKYEFVPADDVLLKDARNELNRNFIPTEKTNSVRDRLIKYIFDVFPNYKTAFAGASFIIIGFFLGYFFPSNSKYQAPATLSSADKTTQFGEPLSLMPRISNVRFIDSDDADGEIEFTFDAVMPVRLKGRVNDPDVQKVLASALISEQNPGIRLQSVSALTSDDRITRLDDELMEALISAVRFDKNPGVRKQALQALALYESDPRARQALLDVLSHDESSGLRIAAINILTSWKGGYFRGDSSFAKILKIKINNDSNHYIRMRSHAILKEIQP